MQLFLLTSPRHLIIYNFLHLFLTLPFSLWILPFKLMVLVFVFSLITLLTILVDTFYTFCKNQQDTELYILSRRISWLVNTKTPFCIILDSSSLIYSILFLNFGVHASTCVCNFCKISLTLSFLSFLAYISWVCSENNPVDFFLHFLLYFSNPPPFSLYSSVFFLLTSLYTHFLFFFRSCSPFPHIFYTRIL
jgi:hypothetical protein